MQTLDKLVVLIVEDNDDFRGYLKARLDSLFIVLEANNGLDGWKKALASNPHIIISDVNMPVMDGLALCKRLSTDKRTSHIPVLLITALDNEADCLEGLKAGAVDYVTKPVNVGILSAKVKNWCSLREVYRRTYTNHIKVHGPAYQFESDKAKTMRSIRSYVEERIGDSNLSINELSKHLTISRGTLYTKVIEMTGMKPLEYVRSIKLERAMELLKKSDFNTTRIAGMTGFKSSSYFAKIFKAKFNQLPTEFAAKNRKES